MIRVFQTLYKTQMRELKDELEEKIRQYADLEGDHRIIENERSVRAKIEISFYTHVSRIVAH